MTPDRERPAPPYAEAAAVLAMFLAFSLVQASIPGVNETHYLSKARHVWRPQWCAGDLFLESSNPHLVFYRTVGALTAVLDFERAALIGRAVCLAVLAWGWTRLTRATTRRPGAAAGAAGLFLMLSALGNWSGEWVVGGVESKVPAYGLALLGTAQLLEGRLRLAGAACGAAVSFHPVVGLWFALALAGAVLLSCFGPLSSPPRPRRDWALGGALFALTSVPGLLPAVALLGGDPELSLEAARYQVTRRLSHHLDPGEFPAQAYRGMAVTLLLLGVFAATTGPGRRRWLLAVTGFAAVFAAVGVAVGLTGDLRESAWRVSLLKFYPFRLVDFLAPATASVLLAGAASRRAWAGYAGGAALAAASLLVPTPDRDSSRMTPAVRADWVEALSWVRANTPADAVILSTGPQWAVKWHAQRPEYANYKDCPQDAESLAAWRRRRAVMYQWSRAALADRRVSAAELADFRGRTGVTHLVASRDWPAEAAAAFANASFRVIELPGG